MVKQSYKRRKGYSQFLLLKEKIWDKAKYEMKQRKRCKAGKRGRKGFFACCSQTQVSWQIGHRRGFLLERGWIPKARPPCRGVMGQPLPVFPQPCAIPTTPSQGTLWDLCGEGSWKSLALWEEWSWWAWNSLLSWQQPVITAAAHIFQCINLWNTSPGKEGR